MIGIRGSAGAVEQGEADASSSDEGRSSESQEGHGACADGLADRFRQSLESEGPGHGHGGGSHNEEVGKGCEFKEEDDAEKRPHAFHEQGSPDGQGVSRVADCEDEGCDSDGEQNAARDDELHKKRLLATIGPGARNGKGADAPGEGEGQAVGDEGEEADGEVTSGQIRQSQGGIVARPHAGEHERETAAGAEDASALPR